MDTRRTGTALITDFIPRPNPEARRRKAFVESLALAQVYPSIIPTTPRSKESDTRLWAHTAARTVSLRDEGPRPLARGALPVGDLRASAVS